MVGAIALAQCALTVPTAFAQDKPADDPKAKEQADKDKAEKERQALLEETARKWREDAAKQGFKPQEPAQPAGQPAGGQPATATPTPPPVATPPVSKPPSSTTPPANVPSTLKGSQPAGTRPNVAPGGVRPVPAPPSGQGGVRPPGAGGPGLPVNPGMGAGAGAVQKIPVLDAGPDEEILINISEEVMLPSLIEHMRVILDIQLIYTDGGLVAQKVYFPTPIRIKKSDYMEWMRDLLEQREYTIWQDSTTGIYVIGPKNNLQPAFGSITRIIRTPNIKPSTLQQSIQALLTAGRGGQAGSQPVFMDDLGIIMMSDSPRITDLIEDFVKIVVKERSDLKFHPFELQNISAVSAKERVLELLGQQAQRLAGPTGGGAGAPVVAGGAGAGGGQTVTNLSERITIDPTANRLLLRGREDERKLLEELIAVVDMPNAMDSRWYPVGYNTALAVSEQGRAEQLGNVSEFDAESQGGGLGRGAGLRGGVGGVGSSSDNAGAGAGFKLYPQQGGFIYRGTPQQHARVEALVKSLAIISADEKMTIEFYKLHHGKSTDVADTIQNLLSNSAGTGNRAGSLLGNSLGGRNQSRTPRAPATSSTARGAAAAPDAAAAAAAGTGGGMADLEGADVFVLADEPNNQILVKAPAKLQPQFRQLISRIDLRRTQVYIDAKIVVVSSTDSVRLAIEAQQIIGQFAFNTNFGLGTLGGSTTGGTTTNGDLFSQKSPLTNLSGLTSALVRSKDVPFIINAIANNIDTRIVATPQLLVDDNEEAEVSSLDQQPTATTSQAASAGSTITSFQNYESAGPKFKVKPQISEGGYMRLEYNIELSSFSGSGSGNLPPPKLENKIMSKSVTVPTDSTIIVGGLTFTQNGKTVIKVPLLGNIPLVGNLFKDQSKSDRTSSLYVFITPKIMRDPTFGDLRLMTQAPLAQAGIPSEYPAPTTVAIPVIDTMKFAEDRKREEEAQKHKVPAPISPTKGAPEPKDVPRAEEPT